VIAAAIADKRYDIALEAARNDYRLLEVVTPSIVEAGLTDKLLFSVRQVEPRNRAEILSTIALKLEQQKKQHNQNEFGLKQSPLPNGLMKGKKGLGH
jgi:hypothetical protein